MKLAYKDNTASLEENNKPAYPFVVLTSYEIVFRDVSVLARKKDSPWVYLVVSKTNVHPAHMSIELTKCRVCAVFVSA